MRRNFETTEQLEWLYAWHWHCEGMWSGFRPVYDMFHRRVALASRCGSTEGTCEA